MNIKKTELVRFEVPTDNVSLWIMIENNNPYYFVEFNGEMIGSRDDSFKRTAGRYNNIRKVIRLQNNILHCDGCEEYIHGTKKYSLDDDEGWIERLCPKCHIKATERYVKVTEVS